MAQIILASASPRRSELLRQIGLEFRVVPSGVDEELNLDEPINPSDFVKSLSTAKAQEIAKQFTDALVVGADTVVVLDGKILGKPNDQGEAYKMLADLSGKWHEVWTGICLYDINKNKLISDSVVTRVKFRELRQEEINSYIKSGEPMDKAGAYAIQGFAAVFVEEIQGCYSNVVGLPLSKLYSLIYEIDKQYLQDKVPLKL